MIYERDLNSLDGSASSAGVLSKWYNDRDKTFIKTSAYNDMTGKYHVEAINECIAYEVGRLIGVQVVPYRLEQLQLNKGKTALVCVSPDYTYLVHAQSVISAHALLLTRQMNPENKSERYRNLVNIFPQVKDDLDKLIVFDYLIDNHDRHMRNIEFYADPLGHISLSPFFDNGSSLLSDWITDSDLNDLMSDKDLYREHIVLAETPSKAFSAQHNTEIISIRPKNLLRNFLNLNLNSEAFYNIVLKYSPYLSATRAKAIYALLTTRYQNLVRMATAKN